MLFLDGSICQATDWGQAGVASLAAARGQDATRRYQNWRIYPESQQSVPSGGLILDLARLRLELLDAH